MDQFEKPIDSLPELLCPAGSPAALEAAIFGGADAVYLGASAFHARMNAVNFDDNALLDAVKTAHSQGVKIYLTMNTQIYDKELASFLKAAAFAAEAGVDALIIADLGAAAAVHQILPTLPLHASTQMAGHNSNFADELQKLGYTRFVPARELSKENLAHLISHTPLEIEMFVHGALCVCHSGQCLFSSVVGGRSGNRGECAQPCRLPYRVKGRDAYPLSLKDLSLARAIPEIIESGVASLKIEGRMKSPEYVYRVASVFRRLLDLRRGADDNDMEELARAFSRSGFTDGYYRQKIDHGMLGVRTEKDKDSSRRDTVDYKKYANRRPLTLTATILRDRPMTLTAEDGKRSVTVTGDIPLPAAATPTNRESIERSLSKWGNTPFSVQTLNVTLDDGLTIPISSLNALRRLAAERLTEIPMPRYENDQSAWDSIVSDDPVASVVDGVDHLNDIKTLTAFFYLPESVTQKAVDTFDVVFLPITAYQKMPKFRGKAKFGLCLPPVIMDSEMPSVRQMLQERLPCYQTLLVGNIGHLAIAKGSGVTDIYGDLRLNVCNSGSFAVNASLGFEKIILSPELSLPQARDICKKFGNAALTITYGRLPLMTLEKCVGREVADCSACRENHLTLTDRRGVSFPILREWEHRNVIFNSVPTYMGDKKELLLSSHIGSQHLLFTVESPVEVDSVIDAMRKGAPLPFPVRRIK